MGMQVEHAIVTETDLEKAKAQRKAEKRAAKEAAADVEEDEAAAKAARKAAKRAAKEAAAADEQATPDETDEAAAKAERKAAKKAKTEASGDAVAETAAEEVDEAAAKAARKAAKKAAKEAAAAADVEVTEVDEDAVKAARKAAKKAAKEAAAAAEVEEKKEGDDEVDEDSAKAARKAAKRAAKDAAPAADDVDDADDAPKAKKTKTDDAAATETSDKVYRVFIKGLPYSVVEATMRKDFEECGEIAHFQLPMQDGQPKGFAFITYKTKEGFDAALKYDGTDYGGRNIGVSEANSAGKAKGKGNKDGDKGKGKGKAGDWTCPNSDCGDLVFARNAACRQCGTARPGGVPATAPSGAIDNENTAFLRGLPWSVTEEVLRKDFSECGEIVQIKLPLNEEGKSRGIAFIKYKAVEGLEAALKFDNTDYGGRTLNVCKSGEGKGEKGKGGDGKGKGKDGKGKKGKAKGKGKVSSEAQAKNSGAMVESTGEKKTFDDSDDE